MPDEEELREFYDQHKGDVTLWNPIPVQARKPPGGESVVLSIRLNRRELGKLQRSAQRNGMSVTRWLKAAAVADIDNVGWVMVSPKEARLVEVSR